MDGEASRDLRRTLRSWTRRSAEATADLVGALRTGLPAMLGLPVLMAFLVLAVVALPGCRRP